MNSSAKTYEPVHGFDISFLPKVTIASFCSVTDAMIRLLRSFIRPKRTTVDVRCCISSFKRSKISIVISSRLPMNSTHRPMSSRKVSFGLSVRSSIVHVLVNVLELQKQPHEINRELKCAREELAIATNVEEPIDGDRFAAAIEVEARETDPWVFLCRCPCASGFHHSSRRWCRSLGTTRWRYDTSLSGSVRFLSHRS